MAVPLDRFINRLVLLWIAGLVGIAGMALISGAMFNYAVSRTDAYADVINLAGRQRTLSQQVVLFASLYFQAETDARRAPYQRQLRSAVDTMRLEFEELKTHVDHIPALGTLYFDASPPVTVANEDYWNAAETLLALPVEELSPQNDRYQQVVQEAPEILNYADQAVQAIKEHSVAAASELYNINIVRILIILAMLAAQFIFAFRPAMRRLYLKAGLLEREIAERLQAEAKLRASEQRFRMLIENAPVGIFQADPSGAITWVNPQWESITGIRRDLASSTVWTEAIHPEERRAVVSKVRQNVAAGGGFAVDFRLAKPSKSPVTLHVTVTPLKDTEGTVISYIGMLIDITERKRMQDQELRLDSERQRVRILGQFIRDTSHDLRTPLSVIKSGLYLVSRSDDINRVREKVGVIDQHVNYLTIVIEQLHEMAVLDTLTELTLMPMYVTPLLRDIMNELTVRADAVGKTARFDLESELPPTLIAPEKLMQAVRAVTNNALAYTETGGSIVVKATQVGSYVEITVCDDGVGIPPEHLPHVFDRFYKVDKARALGGGAGLGLSIAKRVIELHGGKITLESQLGKGTTVSMTLIVAGNRLADLFAS